MDLWENESSTPDGSQPSSALGVGELTQRIRDLLEDGFNRFWIRGEVTNLRKQASGHTYFTLKDDDAQLSCVLFRGDANRQEVEPENGREYILFGGLSVYPPRGSYQMIVRLVIESGAGRLQAEFERIKARLGAEGLFDAAKKSPLPEFPHRIAVVTSPTGAALQDFLSILRRRGFRGEVVLVPAAVQGEHAPDELRRALDAALRQTPDVVVITRGGGSMEDLWAFNDPDLVRDVAAAHTPIISAVGHEIDFVLTDFAADRRAETPSGAAELLSSLQQSWLETFKRLLARLYERQHFTYQLKASGFAALFEGARQLNPIRRIERAHLDVDQNEERLTGKFRSHLASLRSHLLETEHQTSSVRLRQHLTLGSERLHSLHSRLQQWKKHHLRRHEDRLRQHAIALAAFDHHRILKRGFTLTRDPDGNVLTTREAAAQHKGADATLQFKDGKLAIRIGESLNSSASSPGDT